MTTVLSSSKRCLLSAYYFATLPARQRRSHAAARLGKAPAMIVFYHRVADHSPNDWTISTASFRRQIHWLSEHFDIVSLAETQRRIREGNFRPSVSITFDDGYADNCEDALPLLIGRKTPFTYFVASDFVERGRPFPHDVAAGEPLQPNTPEQLRALAAAGVEIGSHTQTHADLAKIIDRRRLRDEVVGSRERIEDLVGRAVRYFAFPYGLHRHLHADVFSIARQAGLAGVCSAYGGYNFPGEDSFHLQRIHADTEFARFRNWLTLDWRKVLGTKRFVYTSDRTRDKCH